MTLNPLGLMSRFDYYFNFIFQGTLTTPILKQNISLNPAEVRNNLVFKKTAVRQDAQLARATVVLWEQEKATCIWVAT